MTRRLDHGQIEVVDDLTARILRQKTYAERIAMIGDANRTMRQVIAAHLKACSLDSDPAEISAEIARRMSGGTD